VRVCQALGVPSRLYRSPAGEARVRTWCRDRLTAWPVPHGCTSVATSLGETHLVEAGSGETVCVYLPGTSFNAATSLRLLGELASACHVVCPDLPGQPGLSSAGRPDPEVEGYGRWLEEVLARVRRLHPARRLVVAGHSRGAAVALAGPTEVDALVLVSPGGLVGVRVGASVLRVAVPWALRPSPARTGALVRLMSGPGASPEPALVEWLTLVARDTRTTGAPGPLPRSLLSRWRAGRSAWSSGTTTASSHPPASPARSATSWASGSMCSTGRGTSRWRRRPGSSRT
jgi:pimeloyl-ACP methyl ester carboxylesterase